ncbi:hypothetical protein [Roseovarius sp. MMSF_3350]|uniref:hypothetical protein n=1 Tax=Roseovarius sp. MMSF_3350 TaxID=3046706 RepID=UPI00273D33EB|nr:hypothetical protein [Roseovarius sp. MMSF_3350]
MADMASKGRARSGPQGGEANGNSALTLRDVERMVQMFREGLTNKAIAEKLAVGHSMVSRIRVGRSWRKETEAMGYEPKQSKLSPKSGKTKCNLLGCREQ